MTLSPEETQLILRTASDFARQGRTEDLAAFLERGVPIDLTDDKGDSLLMLAAYHGHRSTVRLLLERGAAPDLANARGQTPLAGAIFKAEEEIVADLLDSGADPDAGTPTARQTAEMFGRAGLLS